MGAPNMGPGACPRGVRKEPGKGGDRDGRVANTVRNARYAIVCQAVGVLAVFVVRAVFASTLGADYLGVEGLFGNLVTILSVSELGVGSAITYALYKPLAQGDKETVKSLMRVFKLAYRAIAAVVALLGCVLVAFIGVFAKDSAFDLAILRLYFLVFVANAAVSYLFSYKRCLIIADQRRYVATLYRYGVYIAMCALQVIALLLTHSYLLFLSVMVCCTLVENVLVSRRADALYPYLRERDARPLAPPAARELKRNVAALVCHKVGGVALTGTDSVVVSTFAGVVAAGLYSNYALIANGVNTVFGVLIDSVSASVGNFGAQEAFARRRELFRRVDLFVYAIYTPVCLALAWCAAPFVELWLGEEYVLSPAFTALFAASLYIQGMRRAVWVCKDPFGLFWADRARPLLEVAVNVGLSVVFVQVWGIAGAVVGTIVTTLAVDVWWEALVLFRDGLGASPCGYYASYACRLVAVAVCGALGVLLFAGWQAAPVLRLFAGAVSALLIGALLVYVPYARTEEFTYLKKTLAGALRGRFGIGHAQEGGR